MNLTAVRDDTLSYFSEWRSCEDQEMHAAEQCGTAHRPEQTSEIWAAASFRIVRQLFAPRIIQRIAEAAVKEKDSFKTDADTIDGQKTYDLYIVKRGGVQHRRLHELTRSVVDMLIPLVQRAMRCPRCDLCDVFIRRYSPTERRGVRQHYDSRAYATAIVTLNANAFRGGYFVVGRDGSRDAAAAPMHLLCDGGDVVVHGFNLLHGVHVTGGERFSLIAWFKREPGLRFSDGRPWIVELAQQGDAVARTVLRQDTSGWLQGV